MLLSVAKRHERGTKMQKTINYTLKDTKSLKPYERNPRDNDKAVDAVAESIKEFGFLQPIVIDKDGVIAAGHTRLKAAEKLGLEQVPVVMADELTEEQIKAFRLADNKTAELADWNFVLLDEELASFEEIDMTKFGFDPLEMADEAEAVEDDYIEPDKLPGFAKPGGYYKLGEHRLICGDSTDKDVLGKLCEEPADLMITDPPYNVNYEGKGRVRKRIENDNMDDENFFMFLVDAFKAADDSMKLGAGFYIWHGDGKSTSFRVALENTNLLLRQTIIWVKSQFVLGRQDYQWQHEPCLYGWKEGAGHYFIDDRKQSTVFEDARPNIAQMSKAEMRELLETIYEDKVSTTVLHEKKPSISELHPTMKPVPLIGRLVKNSSRPGEIVLDPFGGSGTTLIACEQLGRRCRMVELDPHYCDVIIDRWQQLTGKGVEVITDGN